MSNFPVPSSRRLQSARQRGSAAVALPLESKGDETYLAKCRFALVLQRTEFTALARLTMEPHKAGNKTERSSRRKGKPARK